MKKEKMFRVIFKYFRGVDRTVTSHVFSWNGIMVRVYSALGVSTDYRVYDAMDLVGRRLLCFLLSPSSHFLERFWTDSGDK